MSTTTVQVTDDTLELLRKAKTETRSSSYNEAIKKIILTRTGKKTLGGYLGRRPSHQLLKDLRDKHDRY